MNQNSLAYTMWNCKYHIVFAPNHRRMVIYGKIKYQTAAVTEVQEALLQIDTALPVVSPY